MFLEISQKSQKNTCARVASGLQLEPTTLLKKRLWHRCFPVNFVKFLWTPFYLEHLWRLLLSRLILTKHNSRFHILNICAKMLRSKVYSLLSRSLVLFTLINRVSILISCTKNLLKSIQVLRKKRLQSSPCIFFKLYHTLAVNEMDQNNMGKVSNNLVT